MTSSAKQERARRKRARQALMQALYQCLLNDAPLAEIHEQFAQRGILEDADIEFFSGLLTEVETSRPVLDEIVMRHADRPITQLDPVERAVIYGALAELRVRSDIPYRVIINEAVTLAKNFGGTDGHRYVNAILDKAARELRPDEVLQ